MSNSHLFLKSGYLRAPLKNGIGRYVGQLQRITIKFCKNHGSSHGIRKFIEQDLINYTTNNPGVVIYLKPRRHRVPILVAEYLNGEIKRIPCVNYTRDECVKWFELLKNESGIESMRLKKLWHTDNPSIQGPWTPFTNRDPKLNTYTFPEPKLGTPVYNLPTASEQLLEMFKEININKETDKKA